MSHSTQVLWVQVSFIDMGIVHLIVYYKYFSEMWVMNLNLTDSELLRNSVVKLRSWTYKLLEKSQLLLKSELKLSWMDTKPQR